MIFYPLIVIFEPNIRLEILNLDTPFTQNVHLQNDVKISFNARWTSIISHMYILTGFNQYFEWFFFFKHCVILPHGDHDGDHGDAVDWFYFVVDWMEMFWPEISHFEDRKVWTGNLWTLFSCQRLHYCGPRPHSRRTLHRR